MVSPSFIISIWEFWIFTATGCRVYLQHSVGVWLCWTTQDMTSYGHCLTLSTSCSSCIAWTVPARACLTVFCVWWQGGAYKKNRSEGRQGKAFAAFCRARQRCRITIAITHREYSLNHGWCHVERCRRREKKQLSQSHEHGMWQRCPCGRG